VELGGVASRAVQIGKRVQEGDGRMGPRGQARLREEALPRFPERIMGCSRVRRQGDRE
jgi:hypothetical protein